MPKLPKGESRMKGGVLVAEQVERMLAAVPKVRPHDAPAWERLIQGAWLSSLRLEELIALSWEPDALFSVDLAARVFVIQGEAQKSRRTETVPMFPDFAAWLAEPCCKGWPGTPTTAPQRLTTFTWTRLTWQRSCGHNSARLATPRRLATLVATLPKKRPRKPMHETSPKSLSDKKYRRRDLNPHDPKVTGF